MHHFFLQINHAQHFLQSSKYAISDSNAYWFISNLLLQLSVLVGLIGSLRIYIKWHNGEEVVGLIKGWVGACIFILLVEQVGSILQ